MVSLFKQIKSDIVNHGGHTFPKGVLVYLFDARFRVILNYRIGYKLHRSRLLFFKLLSRYYAYKLITKRSCQISYKATLGANVKFMHPLGVVVGDEVIIGDDVRIWQQVTLGSHGKTGEKISYPVIGNGVKIYAGAKIIGNIVIGNHSVIGANSVVNKDVSPCDVVAGIPSKSLK